MGWQVSSRRCLALFAVERKAINIHTHPLRRSKIVHRRNTSSPEGAQSPDPLKLSGVRVLLSLLRDYSLPGEW